MLTLVMLTLVWLFCISLNYGWVFHSFATKKSVKFRLFSTLDELSIEHHAVEDVEESSTVKKLNDQTFSWIKQWYPVAVDSFTDRTKPNEVQLLGNQLVLWHNGEEWCTFSDVCPHRGVPLSQGRVEKNGELLCAYHAWTFDSTGKCTNIPQTNGGEERKAVLLNNPKSCAIVYPTQVLQGLIWVWGEGGKIGSNVALEAALKKPMLIDEITEKTVYTHVFQDLPYGFYYFIFN
jgi:phenylpropionate dioxygenase-like ring-hydroxylating dioxygenase large terminal subunit